MSFSTQQQLLMQLAKGGIGNTLIQKADLQLADLMASDGYLEPEQAMQWIRTAIKSDPLLRLTTNRNTMRPTYKEAKIAFEGDVLRLGTPGRALTEAERVKPDLDGIEITPVLLKAEASFDRETLEDNIEQGNLATVIREELAKAAARDLGKVLSIGDTAGTPGSYLTAFDGIIKQTTSNLVPGVGTPLDKNVLRAMFKVFEDQFLDKTKVKFITSPDAEEDYRDSIASRQTVNGDMVYGALAGDMIPRVAYNGVEVMPNMLFPVDLGVGNDETVVILTDPKNIVGVWRRDVLIETDYSPRAGAWSVILSFRYAAKYREVRAAGKATGVLLSAA